MFFIGIFIRIRLAFLAFIAARLDEISNKKQEPEVEFTARDVSNAILAWRDRNVAMLHNSNNMQHLLAASDVAGMIVSHHTFRPKTKVNLKVKTRNLESYKALHWLIEFHLAYEEVLAPEINNNLFRVRQGLAFEAEACMDCLTPTSNSICDSCERTDKAMAEATYAAHQEDEE